MKHLISFWGLATCSMVGMTACGSDGSPGTTGSGGIPGASGMNGSGGSSVMGMGGTPSPTGGSANPAATGGAASGTGGSGTAGRSGSGGMSGPGGTTSSGGASGMSGATSAGGASTGGGGSGTGGSAGAGGASSCAMPAWDVTYNLDGSQFNVKDTPLGAGDQMNTATPPYTAPNEIGPGTMVIRFIDMGGSPGPGTATIMSYTMNLEFTVGTADTAQVHTDLTQDGIAGACGDATGAYAGSTVTWNPGFTKMRSHGTTTCMGSLCSLGGLPNGTPQTQDDMGIPQALNPFMFSNGVSNFTMAEVQHSKDSKSSTWMSFVGKETARVAACECP